MRIRDKPATQAWARRRIRLYAARVSLGYNPRVVWTIDDWLALGAHRADRQRSFGSKALSHAPLHALFINMAEHMCRHDLDDTCAHEVVHLRWPTLPHNELFFKRVAAIRRGVRARPHGGRLPAALAD